MRRLIPGARLGAYRLVEHLGAGAMAEVWRATADGPAGFQRSVVLKRPLPAVAAEPTLVTRFVEEARLSARLDHPNIVRTFSLEEIDGVYTLVLEHVHGRDLRAFLRAQAEHGPPDPGLAAVIVREICRGLTAAHAHTIVHRDVSPSNVLLG
jgi:serine/threonine-protein kinase